MDMEKVLSTLEGFAPIDKLIRLTKLPIRFCPEPFTHIIPSITMGQDGPTLSRLVLVSENYLCDVRLLEQPYDFDYMEKKTIRNYRFELWMHEVVGEGQARKAYEIARVVLIHGEISIGGGFTTRL